MIVQPAALTDIDTVLAWRAERAAWLARRGTDQWQVPWPVPAAREAVESGQLWMIYDGDEPAASFMLSDHTQVTSLWKLDTDADDPLWLPADRPHDALYVSKMVVPMARAGGQLGEEILDWCAGKAFEAGRLWLRLDCWTTNAGLRGWYERQGFRLVRVVPSRVSGACYQRPSQPYVGWRLKTRA